MDIDWLISFDSLISTLEGLEDLVNGALSALRQLLERESLLKMMKNAFYYTSKALFVLKIFKFLS